MIQRLYVVSQPLYSRSLTKKSVWKAVAFIGFVSFTLNLWTIYVFHLIENETNNRIYCDVNSELMLTYLISSSTYICFTIFIPSIIIFVCNTLVIYKTTKHKTLRNELTHRSVRRRLTTISRNQQSRKVTFRPNEVDSNEIKTETLSPEDSNVEQKKRLKPHYWTKDQIIRRQNNGRKKMNSFQKLTVTLLLVSFSFVALNLPNFLLWLVYFYSTTFLNVSDVVADKLFENFKFSEIAYLVSIMIAHTFFSYRDIRI